MALIQMLSIVRPLFQQNDLNQGHKNRPPLYAICG